MNIPLRRTWLALATLVLLFLAAAAPARAKGKLVSAWLDREISIDGELNEWREQLVYLSGVDTFIAASNDDQFLYLCLYSQNPEIARQIAIDGLRVRVEIKKLGDFVVHYPVGSAVVRGSGRRSQPPREQALVEVIELELPGQRERVAVSSDGLAGIAAAVSREGTFVYELQLPLQKGAATPWALNLRPGDEVRLVIENPQIDTLASEQATRGRQQHNSPYENSGSPGLGGPTNDPGWTGGGLRNESFQQDRYVFLLKTRLELAKSP